MVAAGRRLGRRPPARELVRQAPLGRLQPRVPAVGRRPRGPPLRATSCSSARGGCSGGCRWARCASTPGASPCSATSSTSPTPAPGCASSGSATSPACPAAASTTCCRGAGAGTRTLGRRFTGGFTAYGYGHVLPQLLRLRAEPGLRWSFLSVGRVEGRLSLVVGEYGRKGTSPRLARYPLDPATGLPELDADGRCAPLEVHTGQPHRMQGVAVDGTHLVGERELGRRATPATCTSAQPGRFRRHRGVLPPGPEDLEWSRPGEALWCVSEWPGARYVFTVDARRWVAP